MTPNQWSWLLSVSSMSTIFLAGTHPIYAWVWGIFSQVLWVGYGITTKQYGFIVTAIFFAALYSRNLNIELRKYYG